jgi:hypothetical protein
MLYKTLSAKPDNYLTMVKAKIPALCDVFNRIK